MISSLEGEFSVKLLNRFRTGTKLTLEGEEIYPLIEKTVNQYFMVTEKAKEPFSLLEEGHYYEPLEAFKRIGKSPNIKYTIHDDYAIMTMVEAGLGVSILAELVLHRTNYHISLHQIESQVYRTLAIGYKNEEGLPIASRKFIEYLRAHLSELP